MVIPFTRPRQLLVVEDDIFIGETFRLVAEQDYGNHITIILVANVQDALAYLADAKMRPDLHQLLGVILDWEFPADGQTPAMPHGPHVLAWCRDNLPGLPVVVYSGLPHEYLLTNARLVCPDITAADVLNKGLHRQEQVLERVLARAKVAT